MKIPEILSLLTLIVCFGSILLTSRFWGKCGLYAYSLMAVAASNMQVLKLTKYTCVDDPVALGTVLFSTTFAVDNILSEYYGERAARQCVLVNFSAYLFFMIVMQIALAHPAVECTQCLNLHRELDALFSPTIALFVAGLISEILGHFTNIFVFSWLKKIFDNKFLSARSTAAMLISTFVDNCTFSTLAWVVFAERPISWTTLWTTYIFITYILRLIVAMLCVPMVKLASRFLPEKQ
jgi:uncharacterized integral membrane protein (TIGR00697 family)